MTGCAGFLGRRLMQELAHKQLDTLGIDKTAGVDILTPEGVSSFRKELDKAKGKDIYIIHLIGMGEAAKCEKDKALAYEANVVSTRTVWGLAQEYGVKKMVFPSTSLVYGTKYTQPLTEEFPPFPENTYARNKLEAENFLVSNSADSPVSCAIIRLANVYGPQMHENTVVNTILDQLGKDGLKLKEYASIRDYVYVDDAVSAIILALFGQTPSKVYNVGSGTGHSVWDLALIIAKIAGKEMAAKKAKPPQEETENGSQLLLNCDRIKKDLGWQPAYTLESGIKRMLNG